MNKSLHKIIDRPGESALGNISRIENAIEKISTVLQSVEEKIKNILEQLKIAKNEVKKTFKFNNQLQALVSRQSEITSALEFENSLYIEAIENEQFSNEMNKELERDIRTLLNWKGL